MRTIEIINLTPHYVNLVDPKTREIIHTFPTCNTAPRCRQSTEIEETVVIKGTDKTITLTRTEYGEASELPDPQPYRIYIVSDIIAKKYQKTRDDLRIINGQIRDDHGKVIGCRSLGRI